MGCRINQRSSIRTLPLLPPYQPYALYTLSLGPTPRHNVCSRNALCLYFFWNIHMQVSGPFVLVARLKNACSSKEHES